MLRMGLARHLELTMEPHARRRLPVDFQVEAEYITLHDALDISSRFGEPEAKTQKLDLDDFI